MTIRFNEERVAAGQDRLANRQVSFWYVAPVLGETFLGHARTRASFDYETGGLWRGSVWGHPVWLVSARELPVEVDTLPLHLLDRDPPAPPAVGQLLLEHEDLLRCFGTWLPALQPDLWEEIRHMAEKLTGIIDWKAVGKFANLNDVVRLLPPEQVIEVLGDERALEVIGLPRMIEIYGLPRVIQAVGLPRLIQEVGWPRLIQEITDWQQMIDAVGPEKLFQELLQRMPAEQLQEILRRHQKSANGDKSAQ